MIGIAYFKKGSEAVIIAVRWDAARSGTVSVLLRGLWTTLHSADCHVESFLSHSSCFTFCVNYLYFCAIFLICKSIE